MRCRNRIDSGSMHARCYLEEGHEPQVCRTYEGKPFTPTITADDKAALRMEAVLLDEKPKPQVAPKLREFHNDTMAQKLRLRLNARNAATSRR